MHAIDEMRMQRAPFVIRKLAVQIGGQPVVNFVVDRCHRFNPLKREPGEVVCALKSERAPSIPRSAPLVRPRVFSMVR